MNYKQAYKAAIKPYSLDNDTIELLLTQQGFDSAQDYETGNEKILFFSLKPFFVNSLSLRFFL